MGARSVIALRITTRTGGWRRRQEVEHVQPALVAENEVEHDDVGRLGGDQRGGAPDVARDGQHLKVGFRGQPGRERLGEQRVIIDDEDTDGPHGTRMTDPAP